MALEGGSGQIPALLQTLPGAEFTQSGVYNMEFNTRGFNGALTRRVQILLDGRDLAAPESKNQDWLSVGFLLPELENIEFVRGPAAALYGADAINGVLAMTTKSPRAIAAPAFLATLSPPFSCRSSTMSSRYGASAASRSSVEPSSMTMISSGGTVWSRHDRIAAPTVGAEL